MFESDRARPPKFLRPLVAQTHLKEFHPAHLESRLAPVGDPEMRVEWYKDGTPITVGHRFRPTYEFNYVGLDILYTYFEDSGIYYAVA